MKRPECNDNNFKSDPLFNREPMKMNRQRGDMITSTAEMNGPCSTRNTGIFPEKVLPPFLFFSVNLQFNSPPSYCYLYRS